MHRVRSNCRAARDYKMHAIGLRAQARIGRTRRKGNGTAHRRLWADRRLKRRRCWAAMARSIVVPAPLRFASMLCRPARDSRQWSAAHSPEAPASRCKSTLSRRHEAMCGQGQKPEKLGSSEFMAELSQFSVSKYQHGREHKSRARPRSAASLVPRVRGRGPNRRNIPQLILPTPATRRTR